MRTCKFCFVPPLKCPTDNSSFHYCTHARLTCWDIPPLQYSVLRPQTGLRRSVEALPLGKSFCNSTTTEDEYQYWTGQTRVSSTILESTILLVANWSVSSLWMIQIASVVPKTFFLLQSPSKHVDGYERRNLVESNENSNKADLFNSHSQLI